ncbi:MAG TPA: GntG family PLP-dependent aldolase [Tepidisphaeraceae bacterium]|jgi:threonine aldolase|nr:GntG family PLP-dependent aldolase [Tepidisphaeraceae bacterium]
MIDLRSDTVTKPTPAMRRAIAEAEVGDDVFGEDPTVNALERATAELLGKEAAMFVPSGTMANQLAVRLHTRPGDEALMETGAHIFGKEAGAAAALSGVSCRLIEGRRGIFTAGDLIAALRPLDIHHAPARLVCVENTHNVGGGSVWPLATLAELSAAVRSRGLKLHMDGARLWNASVASGVAERAYAEHCDSVAVCFSKGLGAPVGSALAGPAEFIDRGRRFRKMLGGGMRQAGLLAAGALHALRHHRERLAEDHANAKTLAEGLAEIPGIELDTSATETNIVRFRTPDRDARMIAKALAGRGILVFDTGPDAIRAVTHLMIGQDNVRKAVRIIGEVMGAS